MKHEIGGRRCDLSPFRVVNVDAADAHFRSLLDDRRRCGDSGVRGPQKVNVEIGGGEIHVAVRHRRQRACDGGVGEHRQNSAMNHARGVVELGLEVRRHHAAAVREIENAKVEKAPHRMIGEARFHRLGEFEECGIHVSNITPWRSSPSS